MTITDKLEGLLPENGPVTDDERVIAEAVAWMNDEPRRCAEVNGPVAMIVAGLALATGCIASAIFVVLV